MLRLIALMLAIHFMVKAGIDLRANERELRERFSLDPLPKTGFRWHHLGLGLEQWRMTRSDKSGTEPELSAQEAWHAYLCRNKFWPRFIRIGVLFILYLLFSIIILRLFPAPPPPARGDLAFQFDRVGYFPDCDWHDDSLLLRGRCDPVEQQLYSDVRSRGHKMGRHGGRKVLAKSAA